MGKVVVTFMSKERDEAAESYGHNNYGETGPSNTFLAIKDFKAGWDAALTSKAVLELKKACETILEMFEPIERPNTAGSEMNSRIREALAKLKRETGGTQ